MCQVTASGGPLPLPKVLLFVALNTIDHQLARIMGALDRRSWI